MLAHHVTFGAYGFWLPNDPRGSGSDRVTSAALRAFGPATKVDTRHSRAHDPHDHQLRLAAKEVLKHPPVRFTAEQIEQVAEGFAVAVDEMKLVVYACAIMPDHVHLVFAPHERSVAKIVGHLKSKATMALRWTELCKENVLSGAASGYANGDSRPMSPTPWAAKKWDVYLFTEDHLRNAIRYVENNPVKEELPKQHWPFTVACL